MLCNFSDACSSSEAAEILSKCAYLQGQLFDVVTEKPGVL